MYHLIIANDAEWVDSGEGPWVTLGDAKAFATKECSSCWCIMHADGGAYAIGSGKQGHIRDVARLAKKYRIHIMIRSAADESRVSSTTIMPDGHWDRPIPTIAGEGSLTAEQVDSSYAAIQQHTVKLLKLYQSAPEMVGNVYQHNIQGRTHVLYWFSVE